MATEQTISAPIADPIATRRRWPQEMSILLVLIGVALLFEVLGWFVQGQSFLANIARLQIMILQVSVVGIIAVGVTQVIITGGIDLSSGSVVAATAMIAATFAQSSTWPKVFYPSLVDLPWFVPLAVGLAIGAARRSGQWRPDRLHENPAIHRHARHDGVGARRFALVYERQSRCPASPTISP